MECALADAVFAVLDVCGGAGGGGSGVDGGGDRRGLTGAVGVAGVFHRQGLEEEGASKGRGGYALKEEGWGG
jgi:hypothetical protein